MSTSYLFLDYLPERPESCLQGAIQALDTGDPLVSQTVSSLESPSAVAVVRELFPETTVDFASIPEPDPRVPVRPVSIVLWRYDGALASPAVAAPSAGILESISRIAGREYDLDEWSASARSAARKRDEPAPEALAAMVHPSSPPPQTAPWDWRFRFQVAAALLAARMTDADGEDPVVALSEIVDGPVDWATTAAIVALLDVAQRRSKRRQEVAMFLLGLLKRPMNPVWFMAGAYPAAVACRSIPDLPDGVYAKLDSLIDTWSSPA